MEDTAESKTLPAGTYIVGDPCYTFENHGDWIKLLESGGLGSKEGLPRIMECEVPANELRKGLSFVASGTAFGDGVFEDQFGNSYGVDAGLIGVVPAKFYLLGSSGNHLVEFDSPFTVAYEQGTITIGHLRIETGDEEEYEEDEFETGEDDE